MKCYLDRLKPIRNLIESDKRELEHLRYISTSIAGCDFREHFSGKNTSNKTEEIVVKIIDLETKIKNEVCEYMLAVKEIHSIIDVHADKTEKLLLRLRYIECLTWEDVAEKMNYSVMQVYRIHKKALKNIKKT